MEYDTLGTLATTCSLCYGYVLAPPGRPRPVHPSRAGRRAGSAAGSDRLRRGHDRFHDGGLGEPRRVDHEVWSRGSAGSAP
ncbi:hypothetical protein GCM10023085_32970 [Actinomadura viridis]